MAFSAVITLTTAGADTGPFNLYTDIDGFVTPFETGVGKAALEAGYLSSLIPDGTSIVRVKSTSLFCTNYINLALPTTTTTTTSTSTSTTTTTTTTTAAPLLRTFRVSNSDTVNSITLDVQINSVQVISPTAIPANSVITLTPQVDCTGFTSELLEYQIVSGYTPSSASFSNGSGTYTGTIAGGFITFTGVDLTANTNQDLTVNP
jgi:hypothetical protein